MPLKVFSEMVLTVVISFELWVGKMRAGLVQKEQMALVLLLNKCQELRLLLSIASPCYDLVGLVALERTVWQLCISITG